MKDNYLFHKRCDDTYYFDLDGTYFQECVDGLFVLKGKVFTCINGTFGVLFLNIDYRKVAHFQNVELELFAGNNTKLDPIDSYIIKEELTIPLNGKITLAYPVIYNDIRNREFLFILREGSSFKSTLNIHKIASNVFPHCEYFSRDKNFIEHCQEFYFIEERNPIGGLIVPFSLGEILDWDCGHTNEHEYNVVKSFVEQYPINKKILKRPLTEKEKEKCKAVILSCKELERDIEYDFLDVPEIIPRGWWHQRLLSIYIRNKGKITIRYKSKRKTFSNQEAILFLMDVYNQDWNSRNLIINALEYIQANIFDHFCKKSIEWFLIYKKLEDHHHKIDRRENVEDKDRPPYLPINFSGEDFYTIRESDITALPKGQSYTYLMVDDKGYYKIGKSNRPKYREHTLQSQAPSVKLLAISTQMVESELHAKYALKRVRGEWFDLTESEIKQIMRTYNFKLVV